MPKCVQKGKWAYRKEWREYFLSPKTYVFAITIFCQVVGKTKGFGFVTHKGNYLISYFNKLNIL